MFKCNSYFRFAMVATIFQQIFLAISTWSIARAGAAAASGNFLDARDHVLSFFLYAVVAYLISSAAQLFTVDAANSIWRTYSASIVKKASAHAEYSASNNRSAISQWISSEAMSTVNGATGYYLGAASVCLNIVLTGIVFIATLGSLVGGAVLISLFLSLAFVYFSRSKIQKLSTDMQSQKMIAFTLIEPWLNTSFFGTKLMVDKSSSEYDSQLINFFKVTRGYVIFEQVVACFPVVVSVLIISLALLFQASTTMAQIGVLVAVLPRSLQLLGNVHALSIYMSQYVMIGQKVKNLDSYVDRLDRQNFESQIRYQDLSVKDISKNISISPSTLLQDLCVNGGNGRYVIKGPNGAGKSSFLKLIKSKCEDCIMVTPGALFGSAKTACSTGQSIVSEIRFVFDNPSRVILLDEWDANLDGENARVIDGMIGLISQQAIVVEVRHKV